MDRLRSGCLLEAWGFGFDGYVWRLWVMVVWVLSGEEDGMVWYTMWYGVVCCLVCNMIVVVYYVGMI